MGFDVISHQFCGRSARKGYDPIDEWVGGFDGRDKRELWKSISLFVLEKKSKFRKLRKSKQQAA